MSRAKKILANIGKFVVFSLLMGLGGLIVTWIVSYTNRYADVRLHRKANASPRNSSRSPLNVAFTMFAAFISWRLTGMEQTENTESLTDRGNHGPGQAQRLATKAR
jgi:hypothetical protein